MRAATIDFDDGAWECQVTASDFTTQDALTSQPVQLVVRGKFYMQNNILSNIFTNNTKICDLITIPALKYSSYK